MSVQSEVFSAVAKFIAANKAEELSLLAPVNVVVENESVKLADDAAAVIEAHDPMLKVVVDAAVAQLQGLEASELPVLEGDGVDKLVAVLNAAAAKS